MFGNSGVHWYDPTTTLWQIAPLMSVIGPLALIKEHIIVSFGNDFVPNATRSVFMLDLSLQSPCWVNSADMLVKRRNIGVGVLNDCIYVVSYTNILLILYFISIYI